MNIEFGTIICAQVRHPEGRGRDIERFYLVFSPTDDNKPDAPVVCLGISRQFPNPPPKEAVLLPYSAEPRSRPMTGLRQRSAVFVDWLIAIEPDEIVNSRVGYVPARIMKVVTERWRNLSRE